MLDQPAEQRPSEVAMTDLVTQDAIERAARDGNRAELTQFLEERHGDGLAETEHLDGDAQHVVLERHGGVTRELERLARQLRATLTARREERAMAHLGVRDLVARDAQAARTRSGEAPIWMSHSVRCCVIAADRYSASTRRSHSERTRPSRERRGRGPSSSRPTIAAPY